MGVDKLETVVYYRRGSCHPANYAPACMVFFFMDLASNDNGVAETVVWH